MFPAEPKIRTELSMPRLTPVESVAVMSPGNFATAVVHSSTPVAPR